jgi:RluA family pseudouridine synthase
MQNDLSPLLLYRDSLILVINKPAGIPVHPGPKGGPSLEDNFDSLCFGLPRIPALAHRLDRDTTGCLVLGRHRKALQKLGKLFSQGRIEKTYIAIVEGILAEKSGVISASLAKHNDKNGWTIRVDEKGQKALTRYQVIGEGEQHSLVKFFPETGRTHQIRVHCQFLGTPIVGDSWYGAKDCDASLCLHAEEITIPLYPSKEPIIIKATWPESLLSVCTKKGIKIKSL